MTTEENKHKEEVERATQLWECGDITREQLEYIFPELKESEEDRIRKEITELIMKPTWQTEKEFNRRKELAVWLEKQGEIDKESYEIAEKEKYNFVSGHFIECRKSFNEFKEDNSYWLEYIGDDNYIGRSDNVLNQKFHITPRQLFTLFTVEHCPKNDENDEDKENEHDIIRKELIDNLKDGAEGYRVDGSSEDFTRWITWLEKQGEQNEDSIKIEKTLFKALTVKEARDIIISQGLEVSDVLDWIKNKNECKPTTNHETETPKFKVGDWICCNNYSIHITSIKDGVYYFNDENSCCNIEFIDDKYHLWSIADAKDGDVLVEDSCIFIIQKFGEHSNAAKTYCTLYNDGDFDEGSILYFDIDSTKPATKEQREQLFKKIEEEGYTWDNEKKELKKVEKQYNPKFKVGDWIVCEKFACEELNTAKIVNIDGDKYEVEFIDGSKASPHIDYIDRLYHLWSIDDAKDGDILSNGKMIVLFKHFEEPSYNREYIIAYIGLDNSGHIQVTDGTWRLGIDKAKPAAKEQRDKLFKAMADKGYEWDAEKKELKKIELKPDNLIEECYQQQADDLIDMVTENSTWNEDDEKNLQGVIDEIQANKSNAPEYDVKTYDRFLSWLKSLKDRIQPQPKQDGKWKWEEDDEKFFKENILIELGNIDGVSPELYSKIIDWISLIKKRLS